LPSRPSKCAEVTSAERNQDPQIAGSCAYIAGRQERGGPQLPSDEPATLAKRLPQVSSPPSKARRPWDRLVQRPALTWGLTFGGAVRPATASPANSTAPRESTIATRRGRACRSTGAATHHIAFPRLADPTVEQRQATSLPITPWLSPASSPSAGRLG